MHMRKYVVEYESYSYTFKALGTVTCLNAQRNYSYKIGSWIGSLNLSDLVHFFANIDTNYVEGSTDLVSF